MSSDNTRHGSNLLINYEIYFWWHDTPYEDFSEHRRKQHPVFSQMLLRFFLPLNRSMCWGNVCWLLVNPPNFPPESPSCCHLSGDATKPPGLGTMGCAWLESHHIVAAGLHGPHIHNFQIITTLNIVFSVWLYLVLLPPYHVQRWISIWWLVLDINAPPPSLLPYPFSFYQC